jgi:cobalt-zinc-cadmium efflux system outer membrane protein
MRALAVSERPGGFGEKSSIQRPKAVPPAASTRTLTLESCFDRADNYNKEILVAAAKLPIAEAAIVIARAIPNPTFSMVYGWGPAWSYIIAGNNQMVGWSEELQILGKRSKKSAVAQAQHFLAALELEAVRFDVHNRMRRSYAELVSAYAYKELIETQREIAAKLLSISQKRFDAGKAPGSEVIQARLAAMQFDAQRNQAEGRIVQDSTRLAQLLGETPERSESIQVDDNGLFKLSAQKNSIVPDLQSGVPPLSQLLPLSWRERNDLKAAIQQAYVDRKALTLAKTQRVPDPVVGFNYLYSTYKPIQLRYFDPEGVLPYLSAMQAFIADPIDSPAPGPPPRLQNDKVPRQEGYMLSVTQESPIFYQYGGQIEQARATWMQQLKQNELMRSQIATDIVTAYEALLVARENIAKFQQEVLPAAATVAQMSRRRYELGKSDLGAAILAQQQYQQLRSNYFDAVVAYQNAWADLEKAAGVPLNFR